MQSVSVAFTAEEKDSARYIGKSVRVAWKKGIIPSITFFTIGSSSIGGTDLIGSGSESVLTNWRRYQYFDESANVLDIGYERTLSMPLGGVSLARADIKFGNTSGRYLPEAMGGNGELFTAMLPRRPLLVDAGFEIDGVDSLLPQFVGITDKSPRIDIRQREMDLSAVDFLGFLENRAVDETSIYTSQRVDQILDDLLHNKLGVATADYTLDQGLNTIPFAIIEAGQKLNDFINKLVSAEVGHFFQDEFGTMRFWNRQHWDSGLFTSTQLAIHTAEVIEDISPTDAHLINVVEVKANPRAKSSNTTMFTLSGTIELQPGDNEIFVDFENPILSANTPSHTANSSSDGSGTNDTSNVTLKARSVFTRAAKYIYTNNTGRTSYITALTINGRWATPRYEGGIFHRSQDDSSVTAYEERVLAIENDYIQDRTSAMSLASLIFLQLSEPEFIREITIRAKPRLQIGDQVSWQRRPYRIFSIKARLNPSVGFLQDLTLVKRDVVNYFKIGISLIGGPDRIAP